MTRLLASIVPIELINYGCQITSKLSSKVASPEMMAALTPAMHTGQRQGDLRRVPWSAYDGTRITLKQSKGGRIVSVRCTAALRAMLDRMSPRRRKAC